VLAEGHQSEAMDISFALQSLMSEYILNNHESFEPGITEILREIDDKVCYLKLDAMGIKIDEFT